jgi:diacylglycerol O-acyltransferase
MELPGQPMNGTGLLILRPRIGPDGSPNPIAVNEIRRHVADRLGALPAFRWRVVPVPFGLSQPVYVADPTFDIARHVGEHVLQAPGTPEVLQAYYAEELARCLDRRRPLWRLTLVHGLAGGGQAAVLTVHHSVADGFAYLNLLLALFGDLDHDAASVSLPDRSPGAARLVVDALGHRARTARRLPALVRVSRTKAAAAKVESAASEVLTLDGRKTPICPLNRVSTGRRTFAGTSLPMADLERIREIAQVTINDVALALVADALREYLSVRGSLPGQPLVARVPIGLDRKGGPPRMFGNRISGLRTTLATDLVDPWERLITISAVTARAKRLLVVAGPGLLGEWLDQIPPLLTGPLMRHQHRLHRRRPGKAAPDSNVVVSHVSGIPPASSLLGAPLEAVYLSGPPSNGVGVNVLLTTYADQMFVGIVCVDAAVAEPRELADGMRRALAVLRTHAAARQAAQQVPAGPRDVGVVVPSPSRDISAMEQV